MKMPETPGTSFKAAEVVDLYLHRPPYAPQIYDCIAENAPARNRLLDLGCGPGNIARPMTNVFGDVTAVDPSANMIALGKSLENGRASNLDWIEATAENAPLASNYDVVTFASSIHWMDPARLFPKLANHLSRNHMLVFISGDDAFNPPWHEDWRRFLSDWVPKLTDQPLDSESWRASRARHLDFVKVVRSCEFLSPTFTQSVEDYILSQHSRNTWTVSRLGPLRHEFQQQLEALLRPHANRDGQLSFEIKTELTFATLKMAST